MQHDQRFSNYFIKCKGQFGHDLFHPRPLFSWQQWVIRFLKLLDAFNHDAELAIPGDEERIAVH
jgi:hypothetical protein